MSATINQKAYLQKYLSGPSGDKKKKKKKVVKGKGFKIIDDDLDLSKLRTLEGDELDILGEGEDAPQVAGIIDERPEEVKKMELFQTTSKWKVITEDDGFNSKVKVQEVKKQVKEVEKDNELIFGKMYSDSEDEKKNDSDPSPPRKQSNGKSKSTKKPINQSDSDFSPPRKAKSTDRNRNDSPDLSPPRKHEVKVSKERVKKRSRWGDADDNGESRIESKNISTGSKRDSSPPNKSRRNDMSPPRKRKDSDQSPQRRNLNSSQVSKRRDSDMSPPRKSKKSPVRKRRDLNSPERNSRKEPHKKRNSSLSPTSDKHKNKSDDSRHKYGEYSKRKSPDSDLSPPRKHRKSEGKQKPRKDSDSDMSAPRKNRSPYRKNRSPKKNKNRGDNSDSDLSPPRKNRSPPRKNRSPPRKNKYRDDNSDSDMSPPRKNKYRDSPPPSNKKMARTLEGKMAGLQDAVQLREENEAFRRREDEAFRRMGDEVSGRNAHAVSRKGKRETSEERNKQREKAERQKELDDKYKKWSRGLKQLEDQQSREQDYLHESSKPLARHRDDKDLESRLKDVEREGDPMLQYIREKKRERGEMAPEKPTYKGNFPPNRFNIRPGYRWDGLDRSNGYEKKFFEHQSKRKAQEEEAYKWSTEDL